MTDWEGQRFARDASTQHDAQTMQSSIKYSGGIVSIYLANIPTVDDMLNTLFHECFHAYQQNMRRWNIASPTLLDVVMVSAYSYGCSAYIDARNDYDGYINQGYEQSANRFAKIVGAASRGILSSL